MSEYYLIAQIKSIFGCEGFISIVSFSDILDRFYYLRKVFIDVFGEKKEFLVEDVKFIDNEWTIKFKNFNSNHDVEFLLGKKIFVDIENLAKLPNDTYYVHDLIGSKVFIKSEFFGYLKDVLVLPGNDVYVVEDLNGKEVLIPAIKEYVKSFDAEIKRLELFSLVEDYPDDEN